MKVCPQCGNEYELDQRFCPRDGSALRSPSASSDLVGQVIAERYHVMKKLGEGGMGQVYLAEHVKMGRKSAVKVMHSSMNADPDAVSRFNREASNASRINHPNVCAIYDFGETPEGVIYLAMEFIEGKPLTDIIEEAGALPPARAGEITRQAADALTVAHDLGIVHRDLKPDNIMVTRTREGADLVKVVDFGIAKAGNNEAQKVTKTGLVVGTPEYMSPEQLAGDKLDGRSDLYSLGLVTYNCLTGTLPFKSESAQEAMIMRLTDSPRPLATVRPDIAWPASLQAVMDRVLARDARDRYATASEYARDLVRAIAEMPQDAGADAGTMVMAAPGKVASATAAPTAAIPATRVASAADRKSPAPAAAAAPAAPPPTKSSPMPMIVGAVVLVGAIGGYFALKGGDAPAAVSATTPPVAAATTPSSEPNPSATSTGAPGNAPGGGSTKTPEPSGAPSGLATPSSNTAAVDAELEAIETMLGDGVPQPETAKKVLGRLESIAPKLTTKQQRADAAYFKAQAYFALEDQALGCGAVKAGLKVASGTNKAGALEALNAGACQ
ncbi:MAG: protein kinase [Gemmatimonadaceae bacterium]|nr:protein kinase [Gemmatimonadaceae bacterium]